MSGMPEITWRAVRFEDVVNPLIDEAIRSMEMTWRRYSWWDGLCIIDAYWGA